MRLIPADKGTHFVVGAVLAAVLLVPLTMPWVAGLCLLAAALREAYGLRRHGHWSWADIAWTMAGAGAVLLGAVAPRGLW
jgi:hypothetical protein